MGIPPTRYKSYPHEFSGGMRQRLMIALALVLRPAFVVADEPTTALDVLVEAQIIRILHDLRRNFDTALLLITHNLGIVAEACDRVAVMYAGEIVETGTPARCSRDPQHPYTRELLRSTISCSTTGLNFIHGAPPDLVEPPAGCRFHPRCPDAMKVCAHPGPGVARPRRRHRRVLAAGPRRPGPDGLARARWSRRRSALPTKPEISDCRRQHDTILDISDLSVHFDLQGGALSRAVRVAAPAPSRRSTASTWRSAGRGARPGRRVRQWQDHARPRAARSGAQHRRARSRTTTASAVTGSCPRSRGRAAGAADRPADGVPGPQCRAQPRR